MSRPADTALSCGVVPGGMTNGMTKLPPARDLNLLVERGVREGRDALVRWAVFLEELLP